MFSSVIWSLTREAVRALVRLTFGNWGQLGTLRCTLHDTSCRLGRPGHHQTPNLPVFLASVTVRCSSVLSAAVKQTVLRHLGPVQ